MRFARKIMIGLMLLCMGVMSANAENMILTGPINQKDPAWIAFQEKHPNVRLNDDDDIDFFFDNTEELTNALLTKEFQADVFCVENTTCDGHLLMEKGYVLDLSDSKIIRSAIEGMYPLVQQQAMHNGRIYALPTSVTVDRLTIDRNIWEEEGLPTDDLPDTITEWFDFLDAWCDRLEADPRTDISVCGWWDQTVYNAASYPEMLTDWVISNYIMQTQFAGQPMTFDEAVLLPLLRRCTEIGGRLYRIEKQHLNPNKSGIGRELIVHGPQSYWVGEDESIVYMRIHEDQPKLLNAYIGMMVVSANTEHPDLCMELLELMAQCEHPYAPHETVMLYRDAVELKNPDYEKGHAHAQANVDRVTEQLKDKQLEAGTREELENDLLAYQKILASYDKESKKYIQTKAQVEDYKQHADELYFAVRNVFAYGTSAYAEFSTLQKRFAAGQITAEQLLKELNRIARMVQLENQ